MPLFELGQRRELTRLHVGDTLCGGLLPRRSAPSQLMQVYLYLPLFFGGQPGQALLDLKHAHRLENGENAASVKLPPPSAPRG